MTKTLDKMIHYNMTNKYYANKNGEVFFNKDTGRGASMRKKHDKVKSFINIYGYVEYSIDNENGKHKHIQAHRIVASLFINTINGKNYVNHIDGNKLNNNINNLEWCSASENELHSHRILGKEPWNKGTKGLRQNKPNPINRYDLEGIFEKSYNSPRDAEEDGYSLKQISAVCNGNQKTHKNKIWKFKEKNEC